MTKKTKKTSPPESKPAASAPVQAAGKRFAPQLVVALIVAAITLAVFLPALGNGFVNYDDGDYVFSNPRIRSLGLEFFQWAFTTRDVAYWHPVTWISHALDYAIWGLNPVGHHLTALLLHALNSWLVAMLAYRLITRALQPAEGSDPAGTAGNQRSALIAAGTAGILFGLHPLRVESVVWISERKDLLCATFFLAAIFTYLDYTGSPAGSRTRYYLLTIGLLALALMSKPMAITFPLVLLILDYFPLQRLKTEGVRKILGEKLPFFALAAISVAITFISIKKSIVAGPISYTSSILIFGKALIFYLTQTLLPLHLSPIYSMPAGEVPLSAPYIFALVAAVAITIACWLFRKSAPYLAAAWGCYLITLAPSLGNTQAGVRLAAADRFTYLPMIGLLILAGLAVARLHDRIAGNRPAVRLLAGAGILLTIVMATATIRQIAVWKDGLTFWSHMIAGNYYPPPIGYRYCSRADAYLKLGDTHRAIQDYDRAVAADPNYKEGYIMRGNLRMTMGDVQQGIADFTTAIAKAPTYYSAYLNRGDAYIRLGDLDRAEQDISKAIDLSADNKGAYNNRGLIYIRRGRYDLALADIKRALALDATFAPTHINLGIAYSGSNDHQKAIDSFSRAIELQPETVNSYLGRGDAYLKMQNNDFALRDYREACRLGSDLGCSKANTLVPVPTLPDSQLPGEPTIDLQKIDRMIKGIR